VALLARSWKEVGMHLMGYDIFITCGAGSRWSSRRGPGDRGAIASSFLDKPVSDRTVNHGEVASPARCGPSASRAAILEARKMGFNRCILPLGI